MLGMPLYQMEVNVVVAWYASYSMLFSIYPLLTAIIGVDAFYSWANIRSCGGSERSQCGTFPYEVDAALGRHPIPDNDLEHDLQHSRHIPQY